MFKYTIDDTEFINEKELRRYISKRHKLHIEQYFHKANPRHDMFDGSFIRFKDVDQYISSLFNNRENMVKFLKENKEKSEGVAKDLFLYRIQAKDLKHQMGQAECRSCIVPSPLFLYKIGLDYSKICEDMGLQLRYDYSIIPKTDFGDMEILIDTREQSPLPLKNKHIVSKLDFGDYCASGEHYSPIYVERKSLNDFVGTMSAGYDRFKREVERAKTFDSYIIVLVEECLDNVLTFGKLYKYMKATPDFIFHRMRQVMTEHDNVQFLFVRNREEACGILNIIFHNKLKSKRLDWQFLYDGKTVLSV
jgi:hypothetical protein